MRAGISTVLVVNRSLPRAERLAGNLREQGIEARALVPLDYPGLAALEESFGKIEAI